MTIFEAGYFTQKQKALKYSKQVKKRAGRVNALRTKILKNPLFSHSYFLNLPVVQCLLAMGIHCKGTIRKKGLGFPLYPQSYIEDNYKLLWDSTIAEIADNNALCFIWQDNEAVAAISTAHSLHRVEDKIQRRRKCPKIN
jgi:Transposase IS4